MKITEIRGIPFFNGTKAEAIELITERVNRGEKTTVFTPNSEIVQATINDDTFAAKIKSADILLPDGIGVIKASRILETPIEEKIAGVEVGEELFKVLGNTSHGFFFFGGSPAEGDKKAVCERAAQCVSEKYGVRISGTRHGYYKKTGAENDETVEIINRSDADILYVCLGSPVQENWVYENASKLDGVVLIIALGGSLDIYSGDAKRAPKIFIKLGCEWLWRLIRQPTRLVRMMNLPKFYFGTVAYKKKLKKSEKQ